MKTFFYLTVLSLFLVSCSNETDSPQNSFFNLNDGNLWVYKRYYSNDNINYNYNNEIDSVRVNGDTLINNIVYSKLVHKKYFSGNLTNVTKECLRVDSNNHLVNEFGLVFHPGTDNQYQHVRPVILGGITDVGTVTLQLQNPFSISVEGNNYFVYSYYGDFISTVSSIPNNYIYYQYTEGIGLISQHCAGVSGLSFYEDRLVYYELN